MLTNVHAAARSALTEAAGEKLRLPLAELVEYR